MLFFLLVCLRGKRCHTICQKNKKSQEIKYIYSSFTSLWRLRRFFGTLLLLLLCLQDKAIYSTHISSISIAWKYVRVHHVLITCFVTCKAHGGMHFFLQRRWRCSLRAAANQIRKLRYPAIVFTVFRNEPVRLSFSAARETFTDAFLMLYAITRMSVYW